MTKTGWAITVAVTACCCVLAFVLGRHVGVEDGRRSAFVETADILLEHVGREPDLDAQEVERLRAQLDALQPEFDAVRAAPAQCKRLDSGESEMTCLEQAAQRLARASAKVELVKRAIARAEGTL